MRLTTGTAVLAAAGLAAIATGCSSSPSSAPVTPVVHHVRTVAAPAPAKAAPSTPAQQLARATRTTLGAHTALFRERWSVDYVKAPTTHENVNPYKMVAGWADFDNNRYVENLVHAAHATQPSFPSAVGMSDGDNFFQGAPTDLVASGAWSKSALTTCDNIDTLADVLSYTTGKITVKPHVTLYGEPGFTRYALKMDLGRQLQDSCSASDRAQGRALAGQLADELVWVNSEGLITLQRYAVDPGSVSVPGVSPALVRNLVLTVELGSFGVKPVIPPHPTS